MRQLKQVGLPVASILLICFYPCAFMFFQNVGEARAVDMLPFFGIFLLTAAIAFLIADLFLRNMARAAILADLGILIVIHFTLICNGIKRLIPQFHNIYFLVFTGVILPGATDSVCPKEAEYDNPVWTFGLGVRLPYGGKFIYGIANPDLCGHISAAGCPVGQSVGGIAVSREQRNVYYMIFDEYGGSENLIHYYDYDNEAFLGELEERGFSVSLASRNTESCWTVTLIPNMMNLDYVTDDSIPINNRLEWLEDPVLYRLFQQNGYQVNLINHNGFLGEEHWNFSSQPQYDETISDYLYENSIFCQIPELKWIIEREILHRGEHGPMESLQNVSQSLKDCWMQAQEQPTLTVSYFVSPHAPFLFDESGKATSPDAYYDWRIPELVSGEAGVHQPGNFRGSGPNPKA